MKPLKKMSKQLYNDIKSRSKGVIILREREINLEDVLHLMVKKFKINANVYTGVGGGDGKFVHICPEGTSALLAWEYGKTLDLQSEQLGEFILSLFYYDENKNK